MKKQMTFKFSIKSSLSPKMVKGSLKFLNSNDVQNTIKIAY